MTASSPSLQLQLVHLQAVDKATQSSSHNSTSKSHPSRRRQPKNSSAEEFVSRRSHLLKKRRSDQLSNLQSSTISDCINSIKSYQAYKSFKPRRRARAYYYFKPSLKLFDSLDAQYSILPQAESTLRDDLDDPLKLDRNSKSSK